MNATESVKRSPLLGRNLVRLLYLDEAGTSANEEHLCVAGVLIHGDNEWPEIDRRISALIDRYVHPEARLGFIFHATDIYHGNGYFDRNVWPREIRENILLELSQIIVELNIPVVAGWYEKADFGHGLFQKPEDNKIKDLVLHGAAATDCLLRADMWLARYAPQELAMVIHEDGPEAKKLIKNTVRILRNDDLLTRSGFEGDREGLGLPLKRIIDTVHFAAKPDARALQLADLCAFTLSRFFRGKNISQDLVTNVIGAAQWITDGPKAFLFSSWGER